MILRTISPIGLSIILQLLIDVTNENEISGVKSDGNKTNLSNLSATKKSTRAGYPTSEGAKKGGGNTKKSVKAAKGFNYLILGAKKAFNLSRYKFTQVLIL